MCEHNKIDQYYNNYCIELAVDRIIAIAISLDSITFSSDKEVAPTMSLHGTILFCLACIATRVDLSTDMLGPKNQFVLQNSL